MADARLPSLDELAALVQAEARPVDELPQAARLRTAIEIGRELAGSGDALVERFVREARAAGLSWTQIGQEFGTSKQAAQKRYGPGPAEEGGWPGRWTPGAHDALNRAGEAARELGHDYIGTEHALLGLLAPEAGLSAHVLADLGVTREAVLATSCMKPGSPERRQQDCLGVMPRLKQAMEYAWRIAERLGAGTADTEHLLAGIVAVPGAMAIEILKRLGVRADDVREALGAELDVEAERLVFARRRRRRRLLAKAS
jgi:Clp amino terminal domain, pathogenicity island component